VPKAEPHPRPSFADGDRSFEIGVTGFSNELVLVALNGPIVVKGYNGDKISVKVSCRAKRHDADIRLVSHGDKYILNYDDTAFTALAISAYIPERMFRSVRVESVGGAVTAASITADEFTAYGSGARVEAAGISAKKAVIESENGEISCVNIDAETLRVETSNAPISLSITDITKYTDYSWHIETSNGRILANVPSEPGLGYRLRAQSALGTVRAGLTGLAFSLNAPSNVEATSANYGSCKKRVNLTVESSNADIILN